jgi:hypothetical protein
MQDRRREHMKKNEEITIPIPRDHFAKMVKGSLEWIRTLIDEEKLPALELVQDKETLESVLIPYTSREAKPHSLFIDPNVAASYQKVLRELPRGVHATQGRQYTDGGYSTYVTRTIEQTKRELPKGESNVFAPVPMSHLAKRVGCSVSMLFHAAREKKLTLVEFVFDEESMKSTLRPYTMRSTPIQGKSVYVMPDEARRYIAEVQRKRDETQSTLAKPPTHKAYKSYSKKGRPSPKNMLVPSGDKVSSDFNVPLPGKDLENNILEIARQLKEQSGGTVERIKILEALSGGKRNNTYLYKKIKYVMDQHIDEFPPHRSGHHAFLNKKN